MATIRLESPPRAAGARWVALAAAVSLLLAACGAEDPASERYSQPRVRGPAHPEFALLVVGDFGIGNDDERAVASGMRTWAKPRRVDAFVSTGDNIYPEAEPKYFQKAWGEPFGWVQESGLPIVIALGNHDVEDGSSEDVIEYFDLPGAWYSRSVGPADIFVLDANRPNDPEQMQWAREALAASHAAWKIVVEHKPPFDCGRYDGTLEMRNRYVPVFERTGVDIVLSGHDHNYQRFDAVNGVNYIVTGGGGDALYGLSDKCTPETPRRLAGNDSVNHFMAFEGTSERMVGFAIAADGTVLDRFTLTARP